MKKIFIPVTTLLLFGAISCNKKITAGFTYINKPLNRTSAVAYTKVENSLKLAADTESENRLVSNTSASTSNKTVETFNEKTSTESTLAPKTERKERREEVKALKKELKAALRERTENRTVFLYILLVLVAIILPPLAVLLVDGLRGPFWLSLLLTLLFYVPGLIYALFRIFRS